MYPNPQDVLPLPPRPDLQQYRRRAKELARLCRTGTHDAIHQWATQWVDKLLELQPDSTARTQRDTERYAREIAQYAHDRLTQSDCALSQAQLVLARAHGFASWTKLARHIEGLAGADVALSTFERAADAIISGDLAGLERLVAAYPDLVHARSSREHHATLLHYVSANGVENYRQKTPVTIVAIARLLLDAGAEVDAEADVYGGGATTLGLVITSAHPRRAGVQIALADLLLERGARMDGDADIVRGCLMNGCPDAAAHMAALGARVDLEGAAGIGRLDLVARYFEPPRAVAPADAAKALMMGSWYDRLDVVRYLLDHGVDVATRAPQDGDTALHIAAYQGSPALVELLVERGAPVNITDDVYHTPPMVWALHAWLVEGRDDADAYRAVLRLLANAGAEVKSSWLDDDRLRADPDLYATLERRAART